MTKNQNKTKQTDVDVELFIASIENKTRREDAVKALHMMEEISGWPAKMWGPTMIGFGSYHYKYDSGREGLSMKIGFSPRKANLVFYIMGGFEAYKDKLENFGKYKTGKSCLYINKLADIDEDILRGMIKADVDHMTQKYG